MNSLLIMKLLILNACGLAALVWATTRGLVGMVFVGDSSGVCYAIAALFIAGMVSIFRRAAKVSRALDRIKAEGSREQVNGVKFMAKGEHIADISQWLAMLGLTGTVIGFIMALHGMDASADPKMLIGQLISGMGVAFYTTLAGAVCGLWLDLNNRILRTATVSMIEDDRG